MVILLRVSVFCCKFLLLLLVLIRAIVVVFFGSDVRLLSQCISLIVYIFVVVLIKLCLIQCRNVMQVYHFQHGTSFWCRFILDNFLLFCFSICLLDCFLRQIARGIVDFYEKLKSVDDYTKTLREIRDYVRIALFGIRQLFIF